MGERGGGRRGREGKRWVREQEGVVEMGRRAKAKRTIVSVSSTRYREKRRGFLPLVLCSVSVLFLDAQFERRQKIISIPLPLLLHPSPSWSCFLSVL